MGTCARIQGWVWLGLAFAIARLYNQRCVASARPSAYSARGSPERLAYSTTGPDQHDPRIGSLPPCIRQLVTFSSVSNIRPTPVVRRLLFLGSSYIYPRLAPQPICEDALMTGPLEPSNAAYAMAKIAGIAQVQAVRQQYGLRWISAMPTNVYGRGDNFNYADSHVLAALIRRYVEARETGVREVVN